MSKVYYAEAFAFVMSAESIAGFIAFEREKGSSEISVRNYRRVVNSLFEWLPEDKEITKERLNGWRESLRERGCKTDTVLNYVKGINRYLDYAGCSDMRFNRGRAKDISGRQFGYLTAVEPTGGKNRKDYIWRCVCSCGREAEFPATRLLTGNTLSCGCLRRENLQAANKYIDGTSIRQAVEEKVYSPNAKSGYTGVLQRRDKWVAYISYKGKKVYLGSYKELSDAVKARARGKELVRMDALGLLNFYEELHKDDPKLPSREHIKQAGRSETAEPCVKPKLRATMSNNTSGYTGVVKKGNKWCAKITRHGVNCLLGTYAEKEDAIAARREAEQKLCEDPDGFFRWVTENKKTGSQKKR